MSRGTWTAIKQSKRFYANSYRHMINILIFSVMVSILLSVAIYHVYFSRPEHTFYATDGITPPIELTAMDEPNNSPYSLLANDQTPDDETRALPK